MAGLSFGKSFGACTMCCESASRLNWISTRNPPTSGFGYARTKACDFGAPSHAAWGNLLLGRKRDLPNLQVRRTKAASTEVGSAKSNATSTMRIAHGSSASKTVWSSARPRPVRSSGTIDACTRASPFRTAVINKGRVPVLSSTILRTRPYAANGFRDRKLRSRLQYKVAQPCNRVA